MSRKVFISILGTSFYGKCKYVTENFCSTETRFAQKAVLEYLKADEWNSNDVCYIFTTKKAYSYNWDITERRNILIDEVIKYTGLKTILQNLHLPFNPEHVMIPDGKDEKEMWKIFEIIFNKLNDNDELYVDLTHSFRYLPMLLLVLNNYAKFLKNISIKHISYGNYESRNKETNEAPIVDLLPISILQDWTFAAANYLENGNVKRLVELCRSEINPILTETKGKDKNARELRHFVNGLEKVVDERVNCRGIGIVTSENFRNLRRSSDKLSDTFIEPFNPVFERIKESFADFDEKENVLNGFAAVKWCLDFGLYQQAATILIENIVTYVCCKHNINWKVEAERLLVNTAFKVKLNPDIPENKWKVTNRNIDDENKLDLIKKVKELTGSHEIESLYKIFTSLSDLRNDFNHAGIRNNPMSSEMLKKKLAEGFNNVEKIINPC